MLINPLFPFPKLLSAITCSLHQLLKAKLENPVTVGKNNHPTFLTFREGIEHQYLHVMIQSIFRWAGSDPGFAKRQRLDVCWVALAHSWCFTSCEPRGEFVEGHVI